MGEKLQLYIRAGVIPALMHGMLVRRRGIRITTHRSLVRNDRALQAVRSRIGGGVRAPRPTI